MRDGFTCKRCGKVIDFRRGETFDDMLRKVDRHVLECPKGKHVQKKNL
jgi:hypothetical protein